METRENLMDAKQIYEMLKGRVGINKIRVLLREQIIPAQNQGKRLVADSNVVRNYFRNYFFQN